MDDALGAEDQQLGADEQADDPTHDPERQAIPPRLMLVAGWLSPGTAQEDEGDERNEACNQNATVQAGQLAVSGQRDAERGGRRTSG